MRVSKANDIRNKVKGLKGSRDARKGLLQGDEAEMNAVNENVNVNENNNNNIDLESVLKQHEETNTSKSDKELVGIYFDPDVKAALDAYQRNNKRGAKSSLVNDIARLALKQKGYL